MSAGEIHGTSYAWELEYRHDWGERAAWSLAYINEGHAAAHHRDGLAGEIWWRHEVGRRFVVSAGAGAYHFSDTLLFGEDDSSNVHGWVPLYSVAATYRMNARWFFRATTNHINHAHGFGSNTLLIGAGRWLGRERDAYESGEPETPSTTGNELTLFYGRSIVNTAESPQAAAGAIEFRRGLARHVDRTVSWFNEGDAHVTRRYGPAAQLWLVDRGLERRLAVGLGLGGYLYFDRSPEPNEEARRALSALISPTLSYRWSEHWLARLTWNRVISDYHRDADLVLLGIGYRWGGE